MQRNAISCTYPVDEVIFNLHLFSKLSPYFLESQLIVGVDESVETYDVELVSMLLR
jgi:hypothetical protein